MNLNNKPQACTFFENINFYRSSFSRSDCFGVNGFTNIFSFISVLFSFTSSGSESTLRVLLSNFLVQ